MKRTIRITVPDIAQIRIEEYDNGTLEVLTRPDEQGVEEVDWITLKEKEVWIETADTPHPVAVLLGLGFAEEQTGGGCTALIRRYDDGGYHVITVENDPIAPTKNDAPETMVCVGYFATEDAEEPSADIFSEALWSVAATFRENATLEKRAASITVVPGHGSGHVVEVRPETWRCRFCHDVLPNPDQSCTKPECIEAFARSMERMRGQDDDETYAFGGGARADNHAEEVAEREAEAYEAERHPPEIIDVDRWPDKA